MVVVENLNSQAVSFDSPNFDFEGFVSEVENWKIAAKRKSLNFVAEKFVITVVVAYMNFGSDSATISLIFWSRSSESSVITAEAVSRYSPFIATLKFEFWPRFRKNKPFLALVFDLPESRLADSLM